MGCCAACTTGAAIGVNAPCPGSACPGGVCPVPAPAPACPGGVCPVPGAAAEYAYPRVGQGQVSELVTDPQKWRDLFEEAMRRGGEPVPHRETGPGAPAEGAPRPILPGPVLAAADFARAADAARELLARVRSLSPQEALSALVAAATRTEPVNVQAFIDLRTAAAALRDAPAVPTGTPAPQGTHGVVDVHGFDGVNLRATPSADGQLIGRVRQGAPVQVVTTAIVDSAGDEWCEVQVDRGPRGFVLGKHLSPAAAPAPAAVPPRPFTSVGRPPRRGAYPRAYFVPKKFQLQPRRRA